MNSDLGHALGIDPGASHSGDVVCRIAPYPDPHGVPLLVPVRGCTVDREPQERTASIPDQLRYADRVAATAWEMLDEVGAAAPRLTFIEGLTEPRTKWVKIVDPKTKEADEEKKAKRVEFVEKGIWSPTIWCALTLGVCHGAFPESWAVAPSGNWPTALTKGGKVKSGWNADPEPRPSSLFGRRPTDWPKSGPDRSHQGSAYSLSRHGLRTWWKASAPRDLIPADLIEAMRSGVVTRDKVVAQVRAGERLTVAVQQVVGALDLDLVVSAAEALKPGSGWAVLDQVTVQQSAQGAA